MRKWLLIGAALAVGVLIFGPRLADLPYMPSFVAEVYDKRVYYRLKSSYLHGEERITFDIVVGCSVRVTAYKDNGSSYDAFRDPVNYTKATKDGGALMQIVPDACAGETTANGGVPKDFLPGAILFENQDDLSLGIGYLAEDAYENQRSELKFLGATIERATRADWTAFRPTLVKNLLEPRVFVQSPPWPSEPEVRENMWDKKKLAEWTRNSFECVGYARYPLRGPEIRSLLSELRPSDGSKYWVPTPAQMQKIGASLYGWNAPAIIEGHQLEAYQRGMSGAFGFPTRTGGGMIGSEHFHRLASQLFPMKADDGVPWATAALRPEGTPIYRDIELDGGDNLGFTYCYSPYWGRQFVGQLHLPGYIYREKRTRIDGVSVGGAPTHHSSDDHPPDPPAWIIENADFLYVEFRYRLS